VITGINGNVVVNKVNKTEVKACWGTQLFQGDQLNTSSNSEATLTFSNNTLVKLGSNSMITISANEVSPASTSGNVRKISSASMINFSALTLKRENKKETGALAGLRSDNTEETIRLTSPCNTVLKTTRPVFSWTTKNAYDKYIVNLYNSKGLVWSKKVSGNTMNYPEPEKELDYGESYFWNVEGEGLIDNEKSDSHKFSVLTVEKSKEVTSQETEIRNTLGDEPEISTLHTVLGSYYINQGLLQDAIEEFLII
jgi:hypothetical protein